MALANNLVLHAQTKHIKIDDHIDQLPSNATYHILAEEISILHIDSQDQLASALRVCLF